MKILIVTTEIGLDGGGMSLSCTRLLKILSEKHTVEVVNSTTTPILTATGGVFPKLRESIQMEYKLKTEVKAYHGFDAVIGFGGKFNGYYASLLAREIGANYILCLRGSDINMSKWSSDDSWFTYAAAAFAGKIVCLSNEMRRNVLLANPASKNKIVIIPNELEGKHSVITFANLPTSVVIGCSASHLNEKKGIGNLLYMISEFKKRSDLPIKLVLVGDIDEDLKRDYLQIINRFDLTSNIEFYNKTTRSALTSMMRTWDFYVQGSVCEGHPNSITEALVNGCAFISTNTGYIAETLYAEYPYLFFNGWDPISMAVSLLKLIFLEDKKDIYSKALKKLQQHCSKEEVSAKWNNLFDKKATKSPVKKCIEHVVAVGLHDVQGELHDSITTPVSVFEKFVDRVHASGYGLCSMKDYLSKSPEERKLWIVCSFDDGYKGLHNYTMPILDRYGFTASVFICTSLIGENNRWNNKDAVLRLHLDLGELQELHEHGWEIASHGVSHCNLLKLTDEELEKELSESHDYISDKWGKPVTYAYPYGAYNDYIKNCVGKYYKFAFAVATGGTSIVADSLQIKRYSITEIYQMLSE